jgi:hypothetical protein
MSNFQFLDNTLREVKEQAIAAEKYVRSDPRVSVFYSRLALEHAVYWLYDHDDSLPSLGQLRSYNGGRFLTLDELMNEAAFKDLIDDADLYQFASIIEQIEKQKAQTQAELDRAETLYQSLLQRAFTGELDFGSCLMR